MPLDTWCEDGENLIISGAAERATRNMDKIFKLETTLAQDLAELYAVLSEEFESKSGIAPADMNRTVLQTGMIHHLTMMTGLGLIDAEKAEAVEALIDKVAKDTIMWELLQMVRNYWKDSAGGKAGIVDFKA